MRTRRSSHQADDSQSLYVFSSRLTLFEGSKFEVWQVVVQLCVTGCLFKLAVCFTGVILNVRSQVNYCFEIFTFLYKKNKDFELKYVKGMYCILQQKYTYVVKGRVEDFIVIHFVLN